MTTKRTDKSTGTASRRGYRPGCGYKGPRTKCAYGPCGKTFTPRTPWGRYCSTLCRVSDYYYRKTVNDLRRSKVKSQS